MDNRWLSVEEIGDYMGVKKDTVYMFIKGRGMPAHKIGKAWKFQTT
ncbi:MAG: excisionase family DNA-binding protein [Fibrobacterales bacterium]